MQNPVKEYLSVWLLPDINYVYFGSYNQPREADQRQPRQQLHQDVYLPFRHSCGCTSAPRSWSFCECLWRDAWWKTARRACSRLQGGRTAQKNLRPPTAPHPGVPCQRPRPSCPSGLHLWPVCIIYSFIVTTKIIIFQKVCGWKNI